MNRRRTLLAAGVLAGCASAPPAPSETLPPGLLDRPPPTGGRLWRLDVEASRLRAVVFRAGAAARLGHHHLIEARNARGLLWLPAQGLAGAEGEIAVPLAELQLDDPAWRREAGGEFDEKPVSDEDRAGTKRNLLRSLQAQQHPELRLQLRRLGGAAPWWSAELAVSLAGRSALHRAALRVRQETERLQIDGRLLLRHGDHGLTPFSVLGGMLAVAQEIVVDAALVWR